MKVGDVVKFSKSHYEGKRQFGFGYVKNWVGIVVTHDSHKTEIMWTINGNASCTAYESLWGNQLGYEPFEVISESR